MRRVVVDPGVIVSAVITPKGMPAAVLDAWTDGLFELVVSDLLLDEVSRVLRRAKFGGYVSSSDVDVLLESIRERAVVVEDPPTQTGVTPDPNDDYLVSLARAAGAMALTTGDKELVSMDLPDVPTLTPRAFLDALG